MPVLRAHSHLGGSPDRRTPRDRAPRRPPEHLRPTPGGRPSSTSRRSSAPPNSAPPPCPSPPGARADQGGAVIQLDVRRRTDGDRQRPPVHAGIVPNETGNNGYYVVAVYRQPGTKSITATLRWDVTFTLQGFGRSPSRRSSSPTPSSSTRAPPAPSSSTTDATSPGASMREAVQLTTPRRYAAQVCRSTWTMSAPVLMAVAVAGCAGPRRRAPLRRRAPRRRRP